MGIYGIKPAFQRSLLPLEGFFVRHGVHPDYITAAALLLSLGGGLVFYLSDSYRWLLLLIPLVSIGRTALNALDGLVAKKTGVARPWGEVLNEFSDRLSDVALFSGLSLAPGVNFHLGMATTIAVLLGSYLGTVARAAGGQRQYGGVMGKADRMVLMAPFAVAAALLPSMPVMNVYLWVVLGGVIITILQRGIKTHADLQSLR
jgi:CDP-diacylglycerol--glycerol-3-phosphate 3-phosphatidyltransferase